MTVNQKNENANGNAPQANHTLSTREYKRGVNACVAKPVDFAEPMNAVKQPGRFWAAVSEPPPPSGEKKLETQMAEKML